jgi:hypothetical protein
MRRRAVTLSCIGLLGCGNGSGGGGDGGLDATIGTGRVKVTPGDKQVTVSWTAEPGATGYVLRRIGATEYEGTKTVADNIIPTVTAAIDGPVNYADPDTSGLVNGETYHWTVAAIVDGSERLLDAPVPSMPDDGVEVPGWTMQHGSTKRDARNTGWRPTGVTLTKIDGDYTMTDGEVIDSLLITGQLIIPPSVKSGTVKRSWIRCEGVGSVGCVFNGGYPKANTSPILFEDVEIGKSLLEDLPASAYQATGIGGWISFTVRRAYVHGVGTAFFATEPPTTIEDSYVTDLFADGPDPHIDVVWVGGGDGPVSVKRNNFECYVGCSRVLGPGSISTGTYIAEANLFNGGSITVQGNNLYQFTGNRFKRWPGGFMNNGPVLFDPTNPAVWTDNLWADDGTPVWTP